MTDKFAVTVLHPTSGKTWEMQLDPSTTPNAIVNELIDEGHLPRQPEGYGVAIKAGATLNMDTSLEANKVQQNAVLVVTPHTKGGAGPQRPGDRIAGRSR